MSAIQRLRDDLVERRLWPVVLVLVVALAAVFLVLRKQEGDVPSAAASEPAPLTATEMADAQRALQEVTAELGVVTPVRVRGAGRRDPFAQPTAPKPEDDAPPGASAGATPPPASGSSSASSASSTPPSSSGSTAVAPSGSASPPSSIPPSAPRTLPAPAAPPARPAPDPEPTTYTLLRTDVRFDGETLHDVVRLRPLPAAKAPAVLFLGPTAGGSGAAFVISGDATVDGDGRCRPGKRLCTHLILRPGEQATVTVGEVVHRLRLLRVRTETTTSQAKAERHYARQSERGRCVLDVLDFLAYDAESGTVAPHHDARECEYAIADDGTVGAR